MDIIKKRLKGLASLFTAAAVSLTAVPMTASAAAVPKNSGSDPTLVEFVTNGDEYEDGAVYINSVTNPTESAPKVTVCSYEQYDNMSLLKTVSNPLYKVFIDGQVTENEDSYISGKLSAGGLWVVSDHEPYGYYDYDKMKIVTGDKLAEAVLSFSDSTNIEIVYLGSIFVYGKVTQTKEDMEDEYGRSTPSYFYIDTQNLREYKFGTLPIDITDAAHELDIKPDDAAYDGKFYEPTDWNIWSWKLVGSGYISNDPVFVNKTFEIGDDFKKIDYFLDGYMPLLQITNMGLINFDIPCAEAADGKLTYTAEEHSAFPTKDGVTEWYFTYDDSSVKVKNSDELWLKISNIVDTDGKTYDSRLASLTPVNAWDNAYDDKNTDSDGKTIIEAPEGDGTIPKDIIEKIKDSGDITIIEYPDGTKWEIDPDSVDIDKVPDNGVDLSVTTKTEFATVINMVTGVQYKMQISIKHNGEFGFTATLIVDLSEGMKNAPAGDYFANLFHVKSDTDMDWKAYGKLDKNNIARLEFTHASDWAIIIDRDKMDGKTLKDVALDIAAPVKGAGAQAAPTVTGKATVESFEWSPAIADGKFAADTEYTLTVKLKPTADMDTVSKYLTATVNGSAAAVSVDENAQIITVTYTFPKTESEPKDDSKGGSTGGHYSGGRSDVKESAKTEKSTGWSEITNEINGAESGSTISIKLNDEPVVPKDALEAAKKNKLILDIDADGRHMTLDSTKLSTDKDLDLRVSGTGSGIPDSAYSDKQFDTVQTITIGVAGTDISAVMKIFGGTGSEGGTADIFYWSDGKLDYVGRYNVGGDGWLSFDAAKGGSYLVGVNKASTVGTIVYGDADGNGKLELDDALTALRYSIGEKIKCDTIAADVDGDGNVTIADALLILRRSVYLIAKFPIEG